MYYAVHVVDRVSGAELVVVVEAHSLEAARAAVGRDGRVIGHASPALLEISQPVQQDPSDLLRRPVWTLGRGIWLGGVMLATTWFVVSLFAIFFMGAVVSSCSAAAAKRLAAPSSRSP